jgi:hypothetical protein
VLRTAAVPNKNLLGFLLLNALKEGRL